CDEMFQHHIEVCRKLYVDDCSLARLTLRPDRTPVKFDEFFRQGKADARAILLMELIVVGLIEAVEDMIKICFRDSFPAVGNGYLDASGCFQSRFTLTASDR